MKKGFTLIELLAVIVILSVITLITVPMITSVIEESKKKALASSVEGLVESANLYAIENSGVYEFLFDKEYKGSTIKGESLEYKGNINGEGKLYLDKEGNTSICISNDKYYAYKNYNSGIIVGERKTGNCIIGFDALTNKYVAMLDNGTGNVSNVYSKDEVDNLVNNLTAEITNMKSNIEKLQNNLNNMYSAELVGEELLTTSEVTGKPITIKDILSFKYIRVSIIANNTYGASITLPSNVFLINGTTSVSQNTYPYNNDVYHIGALVRFDSRTSFTLLSIGGGGVSNIKVVVNGYN